MYPQFWIRESTKISFRLVGHFQSWFINLSWHWVNEIFRYFRWNFSQLVSYAWLQLPNCFNLSSSTVNMARQDPLEMFDRIQSQARSRPLHQPWQRLLIQEQESTTSSSNRNNNVILFEDEVVVYNMLSKWNNNCALCRSSTLLSEFVVGGIVAMGVLSFPEKAALTVRLPSPKCLLNFQRSCQ